MILPCVSEGVQSSERLAFMVIPRFAIVAVFAALVFISKLPILDVPFYWDEMAWVSQARWLAQGTLFHALPGLRGASAFFGHPPGLHLTLAVLVKFFGFSIALAHLLPIGFAFIGTLFTYLLGRSLYDTRAGLLAALCLFLSPIYFAQAGMFLADLPVAALGVACVYLALRGSYRPYVLCASYMVLLKETAVAVVVAVALYRALTGGALKERLRRLIAYAVPLVVIGLFVAWQKLMTGRWFFIYPPNLHLELLVPTPRVVLHQVVVITRWLFVYQGRWMFTAAIILNLVLHRETRRRRELWLLALMALLSGYAFALLYFLPRYILPALPIVYVIGAWSLLELFTMPAWRTAVVAITVVFMAWTLTHQPLTSSSEFNLRYLDVVAIHRTMCGLIAAEHPGSRVLTAWPHTQELRQPELGYVKQAVRAESFNDGSELDDRGADLILVSTVPLTDDMTELRDYAVRNGWRLLRRLENGPAISELYQRSE